MCYEYNKNKQFIFPIKVQNSPHVKMEIYIHSGAGVGYEGFCGSTGIFTNSKFLVLMLI